MKIIKLLKNNFIHTLKAISSKLKATNLSPLQAISYKLKAVNGFSLTEAILASSLFVLVTTALAGALIYGQESTSLSGARTRALLFAEEGLEALRNLKEGNFANIPDGNNFGLEISGNKWMLVANAPDTQGIFSRKIEISSITSEKKQAKSIVSWQQNPRRLGQVVLQTIFTDWKRAVAPPPKADWTRPFLQSFLNFPGNQSGLKIQVQGNFAYVVRNGGNPNFVIVDISVPQTPTIAGSLNLAGTPTNIALGGNFAFVASAQNNQELQIIDISNPQSPQLVSIYNVPGTANANGIFFVDSKVYLTKTSSTSAEFFVINVVNPQNPSLLGSLDLGATGFEVLVMGNTAYVAGSNNSQELIDINITNPNSPQIIGALNLPGNADASTITGFAGTVILGRSNGEVFIVNAQNPSSPQVLSTFNLGSTVNDLSLGFANTYLFIASDENSGEFQLYDISNLSSPKSIGLLDLSDDLNGIAYDAVLDRAFGVGDNGAQEFIVIAPTII